MLRGSQDCSALRRFQRLGLAFGPPFAALGHGSLRSQAAAPPQKAGPKGTN